MKRILTAGLMMMLVLAFVAIQVQAGPGCGSTAKTTKATGCAASAKTTTAMSPEECAKLCGMTPEQCAKMCAGKDNCGFTTMSIKGMAGEGCEKAVTAALSDVSGVHHVMKVDRKEGKAYLCIDASKCQNEALTKAVANKGYDAEVIPAVARLGSDGKSTAAPGCGAAAAGCMSKKPCTPGCTAASAKDPVEKKKDDGSR